MSVGQVSRLQRFRGTFLERWGKYWQNVYIDYKEVAVDVAKECRTRPVKAAIYTSGLAALVYLHKHNPDETSFREHLLLNAMKLMQVGESIRNPVSVQYLKQLEQSYNEGTIRRLNLGVVSFIWLDNYDRTCSLYKAVCSYLKPRYVTFQERILDVGFLDKWWILENKMKDYDVNEAEFMDV